MLAVSRKDRRVMRALAGSRCLAGVSRAVNRATVGLLPSSPNPVELLAVPAASSTGLTSNFTAISSMFRALYTRSSLSAGRAARWLYRSGAVFGVENGPTEGGSEEGNGFPAELRITRELHLLQARSLAGAGLAGASRCTCEACLLHPDSYGVPHSGKPCRFPLADSPQAFVSPAATRERGRTLHGS
jgi:hypothetical protein